MVRSTLRVTCVCTAVIAAIGLVGSCGRPARQHAASAGQLGAGVVTGALFLFVGIQYERTHRRQIADLGGLANRWPLFTAFFGVFMLASLGLPGLSGFVGEFLVLLGTFRLEGPVSGLFWGPLAAVGVILAAVYLLWMFQRVMYGPVREAYARLPDLSPVEVACALPLLALTIVLGVFPQPFIEIIEPSLERMITIAQAGAVAIR